MDILKENGQTRECCCLTQFFTVRAHQANSHQGKGWEQFTDAVIEAVNAQDRPIVIFFVGRTCRQKS